MHGFIYVGSFLVTVLMSGGASGNNGDGVCKLNDDAAGLLCAIAKLVEKAKDITETHKAKEAEDALGDVDLHKAQLDRHRELLEGLLEEAKQKGTLTAQEADRLKSTADEAQRKNDEVHVKAHEVMKNHTVHHERTKNATKKALGETLIQGNCRTTASLLHVLQCHVKGEQWKTGVNIETACSGKNYPKHFTGHFGKNIDNCNGIGKENYCNGTGAALEEALDEWIKKGTKGTDTDSRDFESCNVKNYWEKHALNARDDMLALDHILETVYKAKDQSLAYYSTVWQIREGIEKGKSMKDIVANARKASQEGAKVVVERPDSDTANETEKKSGKTTSPVEEEVKVTVQLDGLKFDEENMPAHSKESFPKIYVYLLAILLPLCCLVIGVTMFCILRRARSTHAGKSIPVDGATMNKVGGTHAQF